MMSYVGEWKDYLIPNEERRTQGSYHFNFIVPKGHKDVLRFSFFPRTITECNLCLFLTVKSSRLSFISSLY